MSDLKLCKALWRQNVNKAGLLTKPNRCAELRDVIFAKSTVSGTLTEMSVLIPTQSRFIPLIINQ